MKNKLIKISLVAFLVLSMTLAFILALNYFGVKEFRYFSKYTHKPGINGDTVISNNNQYRDIVLASRNKVVNPILVSNVANDTINLSNAYSKDTCLIFYIPLENCSVCVEEELEALLTIFPPDDYYNKVVVIRDVENMRFLDVLSKQCKHKIYSRVSGLENLEVYSLRLPFYFLLVNGAAVDNVYVPDKNNNAERNQYFDSILKIL